MLEIIKERLEEMKKLENELIDLEQTNETIMEYNQRLQDLDEAKIQLNNAIDSADIDKIEKWNPGHKKGQDEYWEGTIGIIRTKKTTRKIIGERFVALYPFLAGKLAKFTLKDVEPEISKEELERVIFRDESFRYEPITRLAPTREPSVKKTKKPKKTEKKKVKA